MSLWVIDSSPLIFLAKLNRLSLLRQEAEDLISVNAKSAKVVGDL